MNVLKILMIYKNDFQIMKLSRWISCLAGLFILLSGGNIYCSNLIENQTIRSGPIPIINQTPVQLLFLQAVPDCAETLPKGKVVIWLNTAITNTLLSESSGRYAGIVDMEMIRTCLSLKFGLHPKLELGISLPFVYSYTGIMDNTILDVEEFFKATRSIREREDPNRYEYHIEKDKKTFIAGRKRSTGIGDLVFSVKGKIWEEKNYLPSLSTRLVFKAPIGDEDRALGSGNADFGFGFLLQKDIKRLTAYLNADFVFPGDSFEEENIQLSEFYTVMIGGEYRFALRLSAIAQLRLSTRPFDETGLAMLDSRIFDLLLGVSYFTKGKTYIQIGGVEDIYDSEGASADITFFLNIGKYF